MKKQNDGKKSGVESSNKRSKKEIIKSNEELVQKIDNQELTDEDIYGFEAEAALSNTQRKKKVAKSMTKLIDTYYKQSEALEKMKKPAKKRIVGKKNKVKPSEMQELDKISSNVEDNAGEESLKDDIYSRSDQEMLHKKGQSANIIPNNNTIENNTSTDIVAVESENVENDDSELVEATIEELNEFDVYEKYRVGVFLNDRFSSKSPHAAISPSMIYNMLYEYSTNTKALKDMIKSHLAIGTHDYYRHYYAKHREIAEFGRFCEKMKGERLISASIEPFLQEFKDMPNVAFKGDQVVEFDPVTKEPIAELSSSYMKFQEIRHRALINHAEIMERGSIEKKTGDIIVNQQQNTTNYESYTIEEMTELDPRDLEL